MNDLFFDTCFLIDLEREIRRGSGPASQFLSNNKQARPWINWTVAGEFAEGFGSIHEAACREMLSRFDIVPMDLAVAGEYASITSTLRKQHQLIGANDLWIAASAVACGFPLVTSNISHFGRIAGLTIVKY